MKQKKPSYIYFLLILILTSLFLLLTASNLIINQETEIKNIENSSQMDYTKQQPFIHEPIEISSDEDFILGGFAGNGTFYDPYIIRNLVISAGDSNGIVISQTSKFLLFKIVRLQLTHILLG